VIGDSKKPKAWSWGRGGGPKSQTWRKRARKGKEGKLLNCFAGSPLGEQGGGGGERSEKKEKRKKWGRHFALLFPVGRRSKEKKSSEVTHPPKKEKNRGKKKQVDSLDGQPILQNSVWSGRIKGEEKE